MDKSFFYARLHIGRELPISMKLFVLFILNVVETVACNMKQENFSSLLSIRYCVFSKASGLLYFTKWQTKILTLFLWRVLENSETQFWHLQQMTRISEYVTCLLICVLHLIIAFLPQFSHFPDFNTYFVINCLKFYKL